MGRKHVKSHQNIEDGDMSGNFTSVETNVGQSDDLSIALSWSGTGLTGEFFVDAKNGEKSDWLELDFGNTVDVTTDTGDHRIIFTELPFTEIRVRYVAGAGTGTAQGHLTMKSGGA